MFKSTKTGKSLPLSLSKDKGKSKEESTRTKSESDRKDPGPSRPIIKSENDKKRKKDENTCFSDYCKTVLLNSNRILHDQYMAFLREYNRFYRTVIDFNRNQKQTAAPGSNVDLFYTYNHGLAIIILRFDARGVLRRHFKNNIEYIEIPGYRPPNTPADEEIPPVPVFYYFNTSDNNASHRFGVEVPYMYIYTDTGRYLDSRVQYNSRLRRNVRLDGYTGSHFTIGPANCIKTRENCDTNLDYFKRQFIDIHYTYYQYREINRNRDIYDTRVKHSNFKLSEWRGLYTDNYQNVPDRYGNFNRFGTIQSTLYYQIPVSPQFYIVDDLIYYMMTHLVQGGGIPNVNARTAIKENKNLKPKVNEFKSTSYINKSFHAHEDDFINTFVYSIINKYNIDINKIDEIKLIINLENINTNGSIIIDCEDNICYQDHFYTKDIILQYMNEKYKKKMKFNIIKV